MIIKVKPDIEKVKSMLKLVDNREKSVLILNSEKFSTIVAEMYYEIIKELSSALILLDGFKSIGENAHKNLIDFLSDYNLLKSELVLMNDLRIRRNKSSYEGEAIDSLYLKNNLKNILIVIKKLKLLINKRL